MSLSSNRFTLEAGTYLIEAQADAHDVNTHKAKIRNYTDSTDAIIGMRAMSNSTGGSESAASVKGIITIAGSKAFELQHRCSTTRSSDGFGSARTYGDTEIYATVVITRLK